MQLLKMTQTFNSTRPTQTRPKLNPKNVYFNILESCIHVPKDDKLIIRKYLYTLAPQQLNESNEIIVLLNKYAKKEKFKLKEAGDKKLQVLLRKFADRLRKQEQWFIIFNKQQYNTLNVQNNNQKKHPIDPSKYCNNFELMKTSIRYNSKNHARSQAISRQTSSSKEKIKERHPFGDITFKSRMKQNIQLINNHISKRQKSDRFQNKKINNLRSTLYANKLLMSKRASPKVMKTQHSAYNAMKRMKSQSLSSLSSCGTKNMLNCTQPCRNVNIKKGSHLDMNLNLHKFRIKQPTERYGHYNRYKQQQYCYQQLQQKQNMLRSLRNQKQLEYYIYNTRPDSQRQGGIQMKRQTQNRPQKRHTHKQTKSRSLDNIMRLNSEIQQIIQISLQSQSKPNSPTNTPLINQKENKINTHFNFTLDFNGNIDHDNQNLVDSLNDNMCFRFNDHSLPPNQHKLEYGTNNFTTTDNDNHSFNCQANFFSINNLNAQNHKSNPNSVSKNFKTLENSVYKSPQNSNLPSIQHTPTHSNPFPKNNLLEQGRKQSLPCIQNINLQLNNSVLSYSFTHSLSNFNTFNSNYSTNRYSTRSIHAQLKNLNICAQDFHDFIIPFQTKQSRSPNDLSLPYKQFIDKLNQFVSINYGQVPQPFTTAQTLYIPFHTQYDLVTFEKLSQFVDEYAFPRYHNNSVKDIYTRMEISIGGFSSAHTGFTHKRISIQDFKKAYQWKKAEVKTKFEQLVKRSSRWATCVTYWELYWLKDSPEFKQFQNLFNSD